MYENLSALIDNELSELERARVLRELRQDPELAERWSRYHIIGLAMRQEPIAAVGDLPARVARTLGDEAAPAAGRTSSFRAMGRLGVAASVVGVVLVGGLIVKLYDDSGPAGAGMQPVQQLAVNDEGMHWEGADPGTVDALNALLVEHGEFTAASGMNGLTAYTKFVAYDSQ